MSYEVKDRVLTAGFAQFPKGTSLFETQKVIGCILVIDTKTETITDANFTFISETTNNFVSALLVGEKVDEGIDPLLNKMEKQILFPGKKAAMQAVISAYRTYKEEFTSEMEQ